MFKLDQSESYWYPVTIELVDAEGKKKKFDYDAKFKRLNDDERRDLLFREEGDDRKVANDREVVTAVFEGWRKVQGPDGADLEVKDSNREALLKVEGMARAIVVAWLKSIGIEGKAKN